MIKKYFKKERKIKPSPIDKYHSLGLYYFKMKEHNKALEFFKKVLIVDPDHADSKEKIKLLIKIVKNKNVSLTDIENKTISKNKLHSSIKTYYMDGLHNYKVKNYHKAVYCFIKVMNLEPYSFKMHWYLGKTYYKLKEYNKSINAYLNAISIDPNDYRIYFNLGSAYDKIGDFIEAVKAYKNAISINPVYFKAYYNIACVYDESSQYCNAVEFFKKSLDIDPRHCDSYYRLSWAYNELGYYTKAIETFKRLIYLNPKHIKGYNGLGWAYGEIGDYNMATNFLKQAIFIDPKYDNAHFNLGRMYLMLKEKNSAIDEYKILKDINIDLSKELLLQIDNIDQEMQKNNKFEISMRNNLSNGLNTLKLNRKYYNIYKKRITLNQTLEKIGKEENLTRERIRQITNKINKKFIYYFTRNFVPYLREKYKNEILLDDSDLKQYFYNDEDFLIAKKLLMENNFSNIYYFKEIDKYLILLNKDLSDIKKKLNLIIEENLPEIFMFYDYWLDVVNLLEENEISFINESDFKKYLKSLKYKEYNDWIIKGKLGLRKLYNIILEKYFTKGLCLDGKGIINIRNIAKSEFGIEHLPKNDRAIVSPICDENVLCGKNTYISIKNVDISIELLEDIRKFIEDSSINSVPIEYIFTKYKNELNKNSSIDNKYFLYGVLRHYYSKEFNFRRAAFIEKEKKGNIRTHKILENYLLEKNRIVSREEIKNELKWTDISISSAILLNRKILLWEHGKVIHVSLIKISDNAVNFLRKILDETMINNNDYVNAGFLYKKIKFQSNDFIRKNKIQNSFSFFSILEYIFKTKYYFRRPHILNYDPGKGFTTLDLFYGFIKEKPKFSYCQMNNHFNKLGFSDGSILGFFYKVSKKLSQISIDEYILKDNLKINDETIEEIRNKVDKKFKDKKYLSLLGFMDFGDFPDIGFEWNPYLLKSVIIKYIKDYRAIEKGLKNQRCSYMTLVKNNSCIKNIVDLILFILKEEYKDKENMTITKITNYLQIENIIYKSLPNEFYESPLVEVDKFGRVKILGELEEHEF